MVNFDRDQFEERAAIAEFDGGLSRFDAESLAAKGQGLSRWKAMELINADSKRDLPESRDIGAQAKRNTADAMPPMQRDTKEETRSMPERDVQGGRGSMALLALPVQRGAIL